MEKIREFIKKNNLLQNGDKLIVGLSGGADSVCLLFVLHELTKEYNLTVNAVHINHMIRTTAGRDEEFSRNLCEKFNVGFTSYSVNCKELAEKNGLSVEETGRNERYRLFKETGDRIYKNGTYKIAVAHHADDLAETFIFNLVRGTGIKGLASIRVENDNIIRPLLCVNKEEIEQILKSNGLTHMEDETNELDEYSRNKIRHLVIPKLKTINDNAAEHIVQTAAGLGEIDDFLSIETEKVTAECVVIKENEIIISDSVTKVHPAIMKRVIHNALTLCAGKARDIACVHTEAVTDLFGRQVGKKRNLIYNMEAVREYDGVHIYSSCFNAGVKSDTEKVIFEVKERDFSAEIPDEMYTKWMDYDKIVNCPVVRYRRKGDYLYVADNAKKSLSDYMINEKIPAKLRDSIPLVADGNHILWVIGYRISSAIKVSGETKRIMICSIDKDKVSG